LRQQKRPLRQQLNIFLWSCYHDLNANENPGSCLFYLKIELSGNKLNFDFPLLFKILHLFEKKIIFSRPTPSISTTP
jgi:hypothetical protein